MSVQRWRLRVSIGLSSAFFWIGATPTLLKSEFTDYSSLYHLKYEILGVRLGFDVLSLRVLVDYILLSFSLPTQGLTFTLLSTLVMLHLTFFTATGMHVTLG